MSTLADDPRVVAFTGLSGAERDAAYMEVERVRREAEAVLAAMTGAVDATLSFADDGHRNTASWLQSVTNCSHAEAGGRVRAARMMRDIEGVGDALFDGHLGPAQVDAFARLHGNVRSRPALPSVAELLIEHACLLPHSDFVKVCRRVEQFTDPDGAHRDHLTSRANRAVSITPDGAGFRLSAAGDALSGAIVEEALRIFTDAEFELDWAEGKQIYGDKMTAHLMARTGRQRRFDAFVKMCRAGVETSATANPSRPLINILCDEETLHDTLEHMNKNGATAHDVDLSDGQALVRRRCETTSGAPVDRDDLLIAALTGQVRRVVNDSAGRVLDLGRRQRLFTGAAREAVLLSGDRCTFPGCEIRSGRIHIDHTLAWASGLGTTTPANGAAMCSHHNLLKEAGFTQTHNPNIPGGWLTYRYDGTSIGKRTSPRTAVGLRYDAGCADPPRPPP